MDRANIPVIITRAEPGAQETYERLKNLGLQAILSPVMTIARNTEVQPQAPETLSGLIFTSANGVRAYAKQSAERSLAAWCVGPATAKAADEAGFATIHESAGNAMDLANFIAANSEPSDYPLLHVANAAAKGDLKRALEAKGSKVAFCPLYEMQTASALSDPAIEAMKAASHAIILIHSAKGAEAFMRLLDKPVQAKLYAVAISEQAALPLKPLGLSRAHIARAPNEDGLFKALENALATLSA